MIPRTHAVVCLDCDMVTRPTKQGRCAFCGSDGVYWLVKIIERRYDESGVTGTGTEPDLLGEPSQSGDSRFET